MCRGLSPSYSRPFKLLCHSIYTADPIPNSTTSSCLHTRRVAGGSHTHISSSLRRNPHTGAAQTRCWVLVGLSRLAELSRCQMQPTTQQPSFQDAIPPSLRILHLKKSSGVTELLFMLRSSTWLIFPHRTIYWGSHESNILTLYPEKPLRSQTIGKCLPSCPSLLQADIKLPHNSSRDNCRCRADIKSAWPKGDTRRA